MRDRWSEGLSHHPFSEAVVKAINEIDDEAGLYFDFKTGGDGDTGETLIFWLDEWIERHGGVCPCCGKQNNSDKAGSSRLVPE